MHLVPFPSIPHRTKDANGYNGSRHYFVIDSLQALPSPVVHLWFTCEERNWIYIIQAVISPLVCIWNLAWHVCHVSLSRLPHVIETIAFYGQNSGVLMTTKSLRVISFNPLHVERWAEINSGDQSWRHDKQVLLRWKGEMNDWWTIASTDIRMWYE